MKESCNWIEFICGAIPDNAIESAQGWNHQSFVWPSYGFDVWYPNSWPEIRDEDSGQFGHEPLLHGWKAKVLTNVVFIQHDYTFRIPLKLYSSMLNSTRLNWYKHCSMAKYLKLVFFAKFLKSRLCRSTKDKQKIKNKTTKQKVNNSCDDRFFNLMNLNIQWIPEGTPCNTYKLCIRTERCEPCIQRHILASNCRHQLWGSYLCLN